MSLDALLEPVPDRDRVHPCRLGQAIIDLEEPYKAALRELVARKYQDGGLSDRELFKRLELAGIHVSASVIHYHRRKICSCRGRVE